MVNPLKTYVMVFTRKQSLLVHNKPWRNEGKETAFTYSVKYWGVLLDPKLNWKQHLTERKKKLYSCMWVCRRDLGKLALWMYKRVLLPQILYDSVVLWRVVSKVEAMNLLWSLQSSYTRAAVGSTEIIPTEVLEVALCLTLWGPRNEIKEKTLHFIRKTDLNTIQIIIFITKYKKKLQSFTKFGWFQTETAGTSKLFFFNSISCDIHRNSSFLSSCTVQLRFTKPFCTMGFLFSAALSTPTGTPPFWHVWSLVVPQSWGNIWFEHVG